MDTLNNSVSLLDWMLSLSVPEGGMSYYLLLALSTMFSGANFLASMSIKRLRSKENYLE